MTEDQQSRIWFHLQDGAIKYFVLYPLRVPIERVQSSKVQITPDRNTQRHDLTRWFCNCIVG